MALVFRALFNSWRCCHHTGVINAYFFLGQCFFALTMTCYSIFLRGGVPGVLGKLFINFFFYRVSRYFRCVCFSHTSRHRKLFLFFFCIPVFLLFFSVLSFWSVERVYVGIASRLSFVISVVLFSLTTLDSTFLNIFSPFFSFFFFFQVVCISFYQQMAFVLSIVSRTSVVLCIFINSTKHRSLFVIFVFLLQVIFLFLR